MCFYNTKQDLQEIWHILWSQPWDGINCSILDISSNGLHPIFIDPLFHTWHSARHQENKVNKTWSLPSRSIQAYWRKETFEQMSTVSDFLLDHKVKVFRFLCWSRRGGRSLKKGFKEEVRLELSLKRLVGGTREQCWGMTYQAGKEPEKVLRLRNGLAHTGNCKQQ